MSVDAKYDYDWDSVFVYDENSPSCLVWKNDRYRGPKHSQLFISKGDIVGSLNVLDGYWHIHVFGKMFNAHNVVWRMFGNIQGSLIIDHIDRNPNNTKIENLRLVDTSGNLRNKSKYKSNKSGIVGVCRRLIKSRHRGSPPNDYWAAQWKDINLKTCSKTFSTKKYGEAEAFQLACEYRTKMIEELNSQGAGYTDRHGK
jgi:hypothetical protein